MRKSNPTINSRDIYAALVSVLPNDEFTVSDIKVKACEAINALGPFERSEFDTSDISQMLAHLVEDGALTQRKVERRYNDGRIQSRAFFYTRTMASRALA